MAKLPQHALTDLRRKQVEARIGLSRSTLYERIRAGSFPGPISLGPKAVGWLESEINARILSQVSKSRKSNYPETQMNTTPIEEGRQAIQSMISVLTPCRCDASRAEVIHAALLELIDVPLNWNNLEATVERLAGFAQGLAHALQPPVPQPADPAGHQDGCRQSEPSPPPCSQCDAFAVCPSGRVPAATGAALEREGV